MANRRSSISANLRVNSAGWQSGLNAANAATQRFAGQTQAAMNGVSRGSTNAGMGMLMLSQGIDDIQYGFKGIVNNIAPLVMSLGGSSGLAGALTIAAVAANQAGIYWDQLSGKTARMEKAAKDAAFQTAKAARDVAAASKEGDDEMKRVEKKAKWNQDAAKFEESLANRKKEVRHATAEADKAELTGSEYLINLQRDRIDRLNEEIDLTEELALARKEAARDQKAREELAPRLKADEPRLEELKAQKEGRAKDTETVTALIAELDKKGDSWGKARYEKRLAKNASDDAEQARLEQTVPGMRSEFDRLSQDASGKRVNDLENKAGPVAEQKKREREAKDKAALAEEIKAFYGGLRDALDVVSDAVMDAAEKAAERAKENAEKDIKLKEKIAGEKMAAEASLESRMLRHRGKDKKADKIDDAVEVNKLINDGWNPKDAEDFVRRQREQKEDESLGPRRRKIRALRPAGKDGEIPAAVNPLPSKPKKGDVPAAEKADEVGKRSLSILERIEENTRKTAAEQQQPAKRR